MARTVLAGVLTLGLSFAGGVIAQTTVGTTTASARITDFQIQVADLTPGDGMAASVVWDGKGSSLASIIGVWPRGGEWQAVGVGDDGIHPFDPGSAVISDGSKGAFTSITGDVFGAGALASSAIYNIQDHGTAQSLLNFGDNLFYTLSPGTALTFSGVMHATVTTQGNAIYANSDIDLNFGGPGASLEIQVIDTGNRLWNEEKTQAFSVTIANTGATDLTQHFGGSFNVSIWPKDSYPISSVDEPAPGSLLLGGLGLLALALRKRRWRGHGGVSDAGAVGPRHPATRRPGFGRPPCANACPGRVGPPYCLQRSSAFGWPMSATERPAATVR